jgi:hypothetical protein
MNWVMSNWADMKLVKRKAFNRILRGACRAAIAAATLIVVSPTDGTRATPEQRVIERRIEAPAAVDAAHPSSGIALDGQEVEGILGKELRSSADENMGYIINVIIDRNLQPRAAIVNFGGFLGIGSRRLAVDWNLLHFGPAGDGSGRITVELTADQVRAAPEYKEGKPVVVLDGPHDLKSHPFTKPAASD